MQIQLCSLFKVVLLSLVLLLVSTHSAFCASIQNLRLSGLVANKLIMGNAATISWIPAQVTTPQSIVLLRNGGPVGNVVRNLNPHTSAYQWKVGNTDLGRVEVGGNYEIMVVTQDNRARAFSNEFSIVSVSRPRTSLSKHQQIKTIPVLIVVKSPTEGEEINLHPPFSLDPMFLASWKPKKTIRWIHAGQQDPMINIYLMSKDDRRSVLLEQRTANDGSEEVEFRKDMPLGRYIIRVQTTDGKIKGESPVFRLVNQPPNPTEIGN